MKRVFLSFYLFVISVVLFLQFGLNPLFERLFSTILEEKIVKYDRAISRGVYHMMTEDLQRYPLESWHGRIEELQPLFGYDITLYRLDDLELAESHMNDLIAGRIAVIDSGDLLYHRIGDSNMVIAKGPFEKIEPDSGNLMVIVLGIVFCVLALITFIWIIPYWRKLKRIIVAAEKFGGGDLEVRAEIPSRSALYPIAHAFNAMAERIERLIASHKELTNAVSHELKTPLSRMQFGLEMLATTDNAKEIDRYTDGLKADVTDLDDLVGELLNYAKLDRSRPDLNMECRNLSQMIDKIVHDRKQQNCNIDVDIVVDDEVQSCDTMVDSRHLERALGNLIQNALKYSASKVEIHIAHTDDHWRVDIDDDGPGIPKEAHQKIFEPFARLDTSRSRLSGGYGLGLAIVAKTAEWYSGEVQVFDSPLGGARFSIKWPAISLDSSISTNK